MVSSSDRALLIILIENVVTRPTPLISPGIPRLTDPSCDGHWLHLVLALFVFVLPATLAAANEGVRVTSLGASSGFRIFAPGKWGQVGVTVVNESSEPATVRASVHLESDSNLRFGRDIWLPANSKRTAVIPFHLPRELDGKESFEVRGQVLADGETLTGPSGGGLLRIAAAGSTAFIDDEQWNLEPLTRPTPGEKPSTDYARQAVLAMLADSDIFPAVMTITDRVLPTTIEGWDPAGNVVVAGKRLKFETAAAAALRQWVSEGGTTWVQMNRCDAETFAAIFGSTIELVEVDRVPLTSVKIDSVSTLQQAPTIDHEEPVELIRAQIRGGQVLYEVNGWPAAVIFQYGNGRVLVTLLDAAGWIRQRSPRDTKPNDPLRSTAFVPIEPLSDLAGLLYEEKSDASLERELIASYLPERIGYRIPGRWAVLGILTSFCIAILVGGLILSARQRLEDLSWLVVFAAILATTVLVLIGRSHRGEVPPTIASFEFFNVSPHTGDYSASGGLAVFQPDQVRADFRSAGSRIDPQLPELSGEIREMIWTDGSRWQWNDTRLSPGVMMLSSDSGGTLPIPVRAQASLGPQGLVGRFDSRGLRLLAEKGNEPQKFTFEDGLLLFPNAPPFAANLSPEGDFLSAEKDRLPAGQFTNRAFLDDEQRRRQALLQSWFSLREQKDESKQPMFLAWSDHKTTSVTSPQTVESFGTALILIPLEIDRPKEGTRVSIPSAMIRQQAVKGESGSSAAFNNRTESWTFPSTRSTRARIRFQMPHSVLPLRIESAKLVLDCHIPSRVLEVFAVQDDQQILLGSYKNATGSIETAIVDPKWLQLDSDGGLSLDISVSDTASDSDQSKAIESSWSLRSSRLEVTATTLPAQPKSLP